VRRDGDAKRVGGVRHRDAGVVIEVAHARHVGVGEGALRPRPAGEKVVSAHPEVNRNRVTGKKGQKGQKGRVLLDM
jgi:hypothetical protein